mmetsp:Transcript_15992/g.34808  ORF Transcript_15992/g.34808 Transcript_15992/m.34808 type:complete len:311 (+) Transcript_15992:2317-3249(+)
MRGGNVTNLRDRLVVRRRRDSPYAVYQRPRDPHPVRRVAHPSEPELQHEVLVVQRAVIAVDLHVLLGPLIRDNVQAPFLVLILFLPAVVRGPPLRLRRLVLVVEHVQEGDHDPCGLPDVQGAVRGGADPGGERQGRQDARLVRRRRPHPAVPRDRPGGEDGGEPPQQAALDQRHELRGQLHRPRRDLLQGGHAGDAPREQRQLVPLPADGEARRRGEGADVGSERRRRPLGDCGSLPLLVQNYRGIPLPREPLVDQERQVGGPARDAPRRRQFAGGIVRVVPPLLHLDRHPLRPRQGSLHLLPLRQNFDQ